jgi:maleylpyruvate isomerase
VVTPAEDLRRVADAQRRFETAIASLDDAEVRRSSRLPGWTIGHVLTHVARNADSHVRRAEAAGRGEPVDQYAGGWEGRNADIEIGAGRGAAELIADVHQSAARLDVAWQQVPESAWSAVSRDVGGRERVLRDLPGRRWQELEVHLVDLGIGVTHRDWPEAFVSVSLPRLRESRSERLAPGAEPPAPGALDPRDELAWLYGRLERADLPPIVPWG